MKYIKKYEVVKYSDKLIEKLKMDFYNELKTDFSKYLTPTIVNYKKKKTEVFLFKPDFGIIIANEKYEKYPDREVASIHPIFKTENGWSKSASFMYPNRKYWDLEKEEKIPLVITTLEQKYKDWKRRKFNRDLKKYNTKKKNIVNDIAVLTKRLAGLDEFLVSIGGVITDEEAKELILQKHSNLILTGMLKYMNTEKRKIISGTRISCR